MGIPTCVLNYQHEYQHKFMYSHFREPSNEINILFRLSSSGSILFILEQYQGG